MSRIARLAERVRSVRGSVRAIIGGRGAMPRGSWESAGDSFSTSGAPRGKGEDNMLVVSTDGRKAALDLRMLDRSQVEPVTTTPAKVDYAAARIHRIWSEHRNDTYRLDVGRYPTPEEGLDALVTAPATARNWNGPYLPKASGILDPWSACDAQIRPRYDLENPQTGTYEAYNAEVEQCIAATPMPTEQQAREAIAR